MELRGNAVLTEAGLLAEVAAIKSRVGEDTVTISRQGVQLDRHLAGDLPPIAYDHTCKEADLGVTAAEVDINNADTLAVDSGRRQGVCNEVDLGAPSICKEAASNGTI